MVIPSSERHFFVNAWATKTVVNDSTADLNLHRYSREMSMDLRSIPFQYKVNHFRRQEDSYNGAIAITKQYF